MYPIFSLACVFGSIWLFVYHLTFPLFPVQEIWDYILDPYTIILLVSLFISSLYDVSKKDSFKFNPRLIWTGFIGFVGIVYTHNYVLKFSSYFDPRPLIWDMFLPMVFIIFVISAIDFKYKSHEKS